MKKIFGVLILSLAFMQVALAASLDTGYIVSGVDGMNGVMMVNGQMETTWTVGVPMKMLNSVTLSNGTIVMPNGYVVLPSGATMWMKAGESMNLNGQIMNPGTGMGQTVAAPVLGTYGMRTLTRSVNVRSTPWVAENLIGNLSTGTQVNVKSKSSGGYWCDINYKNYANAWVACHYLAQ